MTICFVLLSYRPDVAGGMERSVAALARGLEQLGHTTLVISASYDHVTHHSASIIALRTVRLPFPATDADLLAALARPHRIIDEMRTQIAARGVDIVCFVDCLWGLGLLSDAFDGVARVLSVHVIGADTRPLEQALAGNPDRVIVPSRQVLRDAEERGLDSSRWTVIPNALLVAPDPPGFEDREALRGCGPLRCVARLGPEKGVRDLILVAREHTERVEFALATAGFEAIPGGQEALLAECFALAEGHPHISLSTGLSWQAVPAFLGGAAVAIVPSLRETFGLVALEAMSVGTPVASFGVGNLTDLLGDDMTAPLSSGDFEGLFRSAVALRHDPGRYHALSVRGVSRSRDYLPQVVAQAWLGGST